MALSAAAPKISSGVGHQIKHLGIFTGVKHFILDGYGAAVAGLKGSSAPMVLALGAAAATSAALTQMDFEHERKEIKDLYRDEIAAKLHKSVGKLTNKDLEVLVKGNDVQGIDSNHTIAEAVHKSWKKRNLGVVISMGASLASFSMMIATVSAFATLGPIAGIMLQGVAGVLAYNAIKTPLHAIGDRVFGIDKQTTHDRIVQLEKDREAGRSITQEQVLSVLASANQDLSQAITQKFGKDFDKLELADKRQLAETLGKLMHVDVLAAGINDGKLNVTELAFTADGQFSGVLPKTDAELTQEKKGVLQSLKSGIAGFMHKEAAIEPLPEAVPAQRVMVDYNQEPPAVSFVERLRRERLTARINQVPGDNLPSH